MFVFSLFAWLLPPFQPLQNPDPTLASLAARQEAHTSPAIWCVTPATQTRLSKEVLHRQHSSTVASEATKKEAEWYEKSCRDEWQGSLSYSSLASVLAKMNLAWIKSLETSINYSLKVPDCNIVMAKIKYEGWWWLLPHILWHPNLRHQCQILSMERNGHFQQFSSKCLS